MSSAADFTHLRQLGQGTSGVCWLVRRNADEHLYALKELDLPSEKTEISTVLQEVHILASLEHPFIVRYYDSFVETRKLFLVMEHAPNGSLHTLLKQHQCTQRLLPEEMLWRYALQLLLGLHSIHTQRVVHRDLKPHNIFLGADNSVKIGDFGVSRTLSSSADLATTLVGSPGYLAPELCCGEPYNEKADIWALGVTLVELCALKHPFGGAGSQAALVLKIMDHAAPPPLPSAFSPQLSRVLSTCMARKAEHRPSALQLLSVPLVYHKAVQHSLESLLPSQATRRVQQLAASNPPSNPTLCFPALSQHVAHLYQPSSEASQCPQSPQQSHSSAGRSLMVVRHGDNLSDGSSMVNAGHVATSGSNPPWPVTAGMLSRAVPNHHEMGGPRASVAHVPAVRPMDARCGCSESLEAAWHSGRRSMHEQVNHDSADEVDTRQDDGNRCNCGNVRTRLAGACSSDNSGGGTLSSTDPVVVCGAVSCTKQHAGNSVLRHNFQSFRSAREHQTRFVHHKSVTSDLSCASLPEGQRLTGSHNRGLCCCANATSSCSSRRYATDHHAARHSDPSVPGLELACGIAPENGCLNAPTSATKGAMKSRSCDCHVPDSNTAGFGSELCRTSTSVPCSHCPSSNSAKASWSIKPVCAVHGKRAPPMRNSWHALMQHATDSLGASCGDGSLSANVFLDRGCQSRHEMHAPLAPRAVPPCVGEFCNGEVTHRYVGQESVSNWSVLSSESSGHGEAATSAAPQTPPSNATLWAKSHASCEHSPSCSPGRFGLLSVNGADHWHGLQSPLDAFARRHCPTRAHCGQSSHLPGINGSSCHMAYDSEQDLLSGASSSPSWNRPNNHSPLAALLRRQFPGPSKGQSDQSRRLFVDL